MVDLATLATYVVVVIGLMLIPGPAVLLVLARATTGGRRIGIATGLGIATGDLIHTLMATFGLSVILATSALAFSIVKYLGVGYLLYLGIRALLEKPASLDMPAVAAISEARAFRQAVLAEMLNPKTALFFLAFLPQFVHPENGAGIFQFAQLGIVFVVLSIVYTMIIATVAGAFARWLARHPAIGRWQSKVIGVIYISLGLRLAMQQR